MGFIRNIPGIKNVYDWFATQRSLLEEVKKNQEQIIYFQREHIERKEIEIQNREIDMQSMQHDFLNMCNDTRGELNALIRQEAMRFWSNYALISGKADVLEAKQYFFETLPKPTGRIKSLQDGNAFLLKKLTEICDEKGWEYWLQSGTLLGAVRHRGFVPWDDDTDTAMRREDIVKLRDHLRNDAKYRVTLVYDWIAKSRQIRFRFRDEAIPCFVDIYIYDEAVDDTDQTWMARQQYREDLVRELEQSEAEEVRYWRDHPYIDEDDSIAPFLKHFFDAKVRGYRDLFPVDEEKKAIDWGIDNFDVKWKRLFSKSFLFPLVELEYCGETYKAPREYLRYLERQYGDIYELPKDLANHFEHVNLTSITDDVERKIYRAIGEVKGE